MRLNLRNPNTQKSILIAGLAFGVMYAYFNFMYIPRRELAATISSDIRTETDMLARGKRIAANFQTVQDDYSRLMASWDIAQELLPTQKEMEDLLRAVATEGQRHSVDFLLFKPQEPVEKPYYWDNAIQIKTLSNYHDLGRFLSAVGSLDRIVNITDLKIAAYRPNRGRSPNTLEADFIATIYIFKELGTPAQTATTTQPDDKSAAKKKRGA